MTSFAMIAGMLPMALAWGEAGQQNAPLGRTVAEDVVLTRAASLQSGQSVEIIDKGNP